MAVLIDRTKGKKYRIQICHYCNTSKFPNGRPILPDDQFARKTEKGDYKCGVCVTEDSQKVLESMQKRWEGS